MFQINEGSLKYSLSHVMRNNAAKYFVLGMSPEPHSLEARYNMASREMYVKQPEVRLNLQTLDRLC